MVNDAIKEVIQAGIDRLEDLKGQDIDSADLHHYLYNEDYFIIGYYQAEQFLNKYGVFNAISDIKQYENDNFGEVTTDLSDSEKVANMFAYVKGEEALNACPSFNEVDGQLTDKQIDTLIQELEAQL